ncbi:hypothetical protein ACLKA6_008652 [Drosophila palustris]
MLSKKEFVAIFLLIIGLLCILNAAAFGKIVPTTTSYVQLTQQIVSSSTAYICVMYALSTWLFHSNYSEPRQHIRIVFLGMLLIMIAAHITVLVLTFRYQYYSKVDETIDLYEIHSNFAMTCRIITIVLTFFTIILLTMTYRQHLCIYLAGVTRKNKKIFGAASKSPGNCANSSKDVQSTHETMTLSVYLTCILHNEIGGANLPCIKVKDKLALGPESSNYENAPMAPKERKRGPSKVTLGSSGAYSKISS